MLIVMHFAIHQVHFQKKDKEVHRLTKVTVHNILLLFVFTLAYKLLKSVYIIK